jgi:SH3 domain-containing YSC84-like protein 1
MIRLTSTLALVLSMALALLPQPARAQTEAQTLVDRATLAVQEMLTASNGTDVQNLLKRARGALICPRVFKAGFFLGGEGGDCVLVGRSGAATPASAPQAGISQNDPQQNPAPQAGAPPAAPPAGAPWSGPAFYGMGGGSFGFQFGLQDSEVIFIVLTDKGLQALLDSQFKFGANASIAVATIGAGVNGDTTAALRADIVAFSQTRGLFAGVSLEGTLLSARSDWNQSYYGLPIGAQQIVLNMEGQNPGAEPLKEMLARFSNG